MTGAMVAEVKNNQIVVTSMNNGVETKFFLIPYVETADGTQEIFGNDEELERVAVCISDFNGVPTEVIKKGFVRRTLTLVEKSKQTTQMVLKALENKHEEAKQILKATEETSADLQALSTENPGH